MSKHIVLRQQNIVLAVLRAGDMPDGTICPFGRDIPDGTICADGARFHLISHLSVTASPQGEASFRKSALTHRYAALIPSFVGTCVSFCQAILLAEEQRHPI